MVLSRVLVQLQRLRQFHHENAKDHRRLIKVLDCMQLDTLKVSYTQSPSKVAVELESFEQLATLASHFYERDQVLTLSINRTLKVFHGLRPGQLRRLKEQLKTVKRDLGDVREKLVRAGEEMNRVARRVEMVIGEFRTRCRETYIEYLKSLDSDLRRILKPLVPTNVLDDEIRYKHINPSSASSLRSSIKSELREPQSPGVDKDPQAEVQAHTELLVNTLETVARELINVCLDANKRYYELVDPGELVSGPPTPLAAQLPEYFSFKAADYHEDLLDVMNLVDPAVISDTQRGIVVDKLMRLSKDGRLSCKVLDSQQACKFKQKLETLARKKVDFRGLNLVEVLDDDSILSASAREKLVFSLINSDRTEAKDVTLEDIMQAQRDSEVDLTALAEPVTPNRRYAMTPEQPHTLTKSELMEPPTLTDISFEGNLQQNTPLSKQIGDFYTPQGGSRRNPRQFFDRHRKSLPPLPKSEKKTSPVKQPALRRSEVKEIRVRSVTPGPVRRLKDERKSVKKSSPSPIPQRVKPKKHSMS